MEVLRPVKKMVENRTVFEAHDAELSIYDTYEVAKNVPLDSEHLLYCGMITGEKYLHGNADFEAPFLPHESFVLSPGETIYIDFPSANTEKPTTCIAIGITQERIAETYEYLNHTSAVPEAIEDWQQTESKWLLTAHSEATQYLLQRIVYSFVEGDHDRDLVLNLGVKELLVRMMRHRGSEFLKNAAHRDPTRTALTAVIHFIDTHLDAYISVDELCKIACMSRTKLYQCFKALANCSPMEYIQIERLRRARALLRQGYPSTEVCYLVGFSSPSHFCRRFAAQYGVTPKHFAQQ